MHRARGTECLAAGGWPLITVRRHRRTGGRLHRALGLHGLFGALGHRPHAPRLDFRADRRVLIAYRQNAGGTEGGLFGTFRVHLRAFGGNGRAVRRMRRTFRGGLRTERRPVSTHRIYLRAIGRSLRAHCGNVRALGGGLRANRLGHRAVCWIRTACRRKVRRTEGGLYRALRGNTRALCGHHRTERRLHGTLRRARDIGALRRGLRACRVDLRAQCISHQADRQDRCRG